MSAEKDDNNTQLNESIGTKSDIELPLLKNYEQNETKPSILQNAKKNSHKNNIQRHEYFLPPMLYSYGPNECESDIELDKSASREIPQSKSNSEKHPEISALSVLSLLENNDEIEKEMDTSRYCILII